MRLRPTALHLVLLAGSLAWAQTAAAPPQKRIAKGAPRATTAAKGPQLEARKRFVLDVVQSALALPQNDPQDRLRVLVEAAHVSSSVSAELSKSLVRQGIELETQIISSGQKPVASMLESGLVDCRLMSGFVEAVRPENAADAERALVAAVSHCPRQALEPLQRKLDEAMRRGRVSPRLALAAMQAAGGKSVWSAQQFEALFDALPDPQKAGKQAPEYADVFRNFASAMDPDTVRSSGLKMLIWLGRMDTSPERVEAITAVAGEMKQVLGDERYQEALQSDIMASQAAQLAGKPFEISAPEDQPPVIVSRLFGQKDDKSSDLEQMPAARRAREAAAYGFAAAHDGDSTLAERYFDIGFRAVNDLWSHHRPGEDVISVIEQITEAAAHVNPVKALKQVQQLQDPPAQAISMLVVAQVVWSSQERPEVRPPRAPKY